MASMQEGTHFGAGRIALVLGALAAILTTYAVLAGKRDRAKAPAVTDGWDLGPETRGPRPAAEAHESPAGTPPYAVAGAAPRGTREWPRRPACRRAWRDHRCPAAERSPPAKIPGRLVACASFVTTVPRLLVSSPGVVDWMMGLGFCPIASISVCTGRMNSNPSPGRAAGGRSRPARQAPSAGTPRPTPRCSRLQDPDRVG